MKNIQPIEVTKSNIVFFEQEAWMFMWFRYSHHLKRLTWRNKYQIIQINIDPLWDNYEDVVYYIADMREKEEILKILEK